MLFWLFLVSRVFAADILLCPNVTMPFSEFEAQTYSKIQSNPIPGMTVDDKISVLLERLQKWDPLRAASFKTALAKLPAQTTHFHGVHFVDSPDWESYEVPTTCSVEKVFRYEKPAFQELPYSINDDLWAKLSDDAKAVSTIEVLFQGEQSEDSTPELRTFVSQLTSLEWDSLVSTREAYAKLILPAAKYTFSEFGLTLNAWFAGENNTELSYYAEFQNANVVIQGKSRQLEQDYTLYPESNRLETCFKNEESLSFADGRKVTVKGCSVLTDTGSPLEVSLAESARLKVTDCISYVCYGYGHNGFDYTAKFTPEGYLTSCYVLKGSQISYRGKNIVLSDNTWVSFNPDGSADLADLQDDGSTDD